MGEPQNMKPFLRCVTYVTLSYSVLLASAWAQAPAPPPSVDLGVLPKAWATGGPNCVENKTADWYVHEYNLDTYILRESGCSHWEKPFIYLLIGRDRALLEDTGAGQSEVEVIVQKVIAQWARRSGRQPVPITIIHSHAHGDHTSGDPRFAKLPNVTIIKPEPEAIRAAIGTKKYPEEIGMIDLGGGRIVDVIPAPGHEAGATILYDRRTGLLLTGDSMYPGRVFIKDFAAFTASLRRAADFVRTKPVTYVLGTHIEQRQTPFMDYKVRTTYQPEELPLELTRGDLLEALDAVEHMNGIASIYYSSRFTLVPRP